MHERLACRSVNIRREGVPRISGIRSSNFFLCVCVCMSEVPLFGSPLNVCIQASNMYILWFDQTDRVCCVRLYVFMCV